MKNIKRQQEQKMKMQMKDRDRDRESDFLRSKLKTQKIKKNKLTLDQHNNPNREKGPVDSKVLTGRKESGRCGDRVGGSGDAGLGRKNFRWRGRGFDSRGDHASYKHAHQPPQEEYDYNSLTTHVLPDPTVYQ